MDAVVALIRGINVGGRAKLAMADLRKAAESCGLEDVSTYIQSGNLVARDPKRRSTSAVAKALRSAIASSGQVDPAVIVRTRGQLAATVDGSPFLARGEDPAHLHVVFLDGKGGAALRGFDVAKYAPEEAMAVGSDVHLLLPGGVGRSKLAADLARHGTSDGTMRNWRTVTKLLALAEEVSG
jgi:uncharacterized protein (DUF1697 family)